MKNNKIYKESVLYLAGSAIVAVLGFITSLLYSFFFTPSDYGVHSLASSMYMLLSQFFGLWMSTAALRFHEKYKLKNKADDLYSTISITHLFISILFVFLLNIGAFSFSENKTFDGIFFVYSIIYFFEYNILIINTKIRSEENAKTYNINVTTNNLLKILILLIIVIAFGFNSIYAISISILLTEVAQYLYLLIKYKVYVYYKVRKFDKEILKELFVYAFPLIGTTITSWILNVSDRYIINILQDSSSVGLYSYAYLLGNNLFWLISNFIMLGAYPRFVKLFEKHKTKKLAKTFKKYMNLYLLIVIPCCIGAILVSDTLFKAVTSPMYHEAYKVFIYTSLGISTLGISQFFIKIFELYKNTKIILLLNVICSVFNIIFNFILIYHLGYVGGAISTLLSYIFYFTLAYRYSKHYINIGFDFKNIKKYIFAGIIMYLVLFAEKQLIIIDSNLVLLAIYILSGVIAYFGTLVICGGINRRAIKDIVINKGETS